MSLDNELVLEYIADFKRPWLVKRKGGEYEQHAHFYRKEDVYLCIKCIKNNKYPTSREIKYAMKKILTKDEFSSLSKKQRYFNPNKGRR